MGNRPPQNRFSAIRTMRGRMPSLPFFEIKNAVLGKNYDLSVVFIDEKHSRTLNRRYRGENRPANILTFPLSDGEGEIYITPSQVKKDAPRFEMSYRGFLCRVFIHGLLHLKGLRHGSTMKKEEARLAEKFS